MLNDRHIVKVFDPRSDASRRRDISVGLCWQVAEMPFNAIAYYVNKFWVQELVVVRYVEHMQRSVAEGFAHSTGNSCAVTAVHHKYDIRPEQIVYGKASRRPRAKATGSDRQPRVIAEQVLRGRAAPLISRANEERVDASHRKT